MKRLHNLPSPVGMTKEEITELLLREEYGYLPPAPDLVTAETVNRDTRFCAGKADLCTLKLTCKMGNSSFSFPVYYTRLNQKNPAPCFVHINFQDAVPDRYQPTEELVDAGYAVLSFCYKDVTSDDGDFSSGLAGVVYPNGRKTPYQCGKIGLWAWAAIRVMDYAMTLPELDKNRISVAGHSRLGKTALLAGALDARFHCAFSNNSGCSGAALARHSIGETVSKICTHFPYWFCENYYQYMDNEEKMPFDQHYLLATNAPHMVYVASAANDHNATPENEYLSCVAASDYFEAQGRKGLIHPERLPTPGDFFGEGSIGYHMRAGNHYMSREDWQHYIRFLQMHEGEKTK